MRKVTWYVISCIRPSDASSGNSRSPTASWHSVGVTQREVQARWRLSSTFSPCSASVHGVPGRAQPWADAAPWPTSRSERAEPPRPAQPLRAEPRPAPGAETTSGTDSDKRRGRGRRRALPTARGNSSSSGDAGPAVPGAGEGSATASVVEVAEAVGGAGDVLGGAVGDLGAGVGDAGGSGTRGPPTTRRRR